MHPLTLSDLLGEHRRRLEWFGSHRGQEVPLPEPTVDGPLATRAKGIYKPAGNPYALSIRMMLSSPYVDKAIEEDPNGYWTLQYFQENPDPRQKLQEYTNRGLDRCQHDRLPVGVLVQTSAKPVRYLVLGLALMTGWEDGPFRPESAALVRPGSRLGHGDVSKSPRA